MIRPGVSCVDTGLRMRSNLSLQNIALIVAHKAFIDMEAMITIVWQSAWYV